MFGNPTASMHAVDSNQTAKPQLAEKPVRINDQGEPWLKFENSKDLPTVYEGSRSLTQAFVNDQPQPLSLATADFDEDGMPDIVTGYAMIDGGALSMRRGNVDAIYPNTPEAVLRRGEGGKGRVSEPKPFLSEAKVFAVPEKIDFMAAGDFDADGHWDVVAAGKGGNALFVLAGDGKGNFSEPRKIELAGNITALTAGEINRADGLTDVIVGIERNGNAQALVFESPAGALNRTMPEEFALPAEATSLSIGQLDDKAPFDLAIATGNHLLVVHGRDRRLSVRMGEQDIAPPAVVDEQILPFEISSLVVGEFDQSTIDRSEIALLDQRGNLHFAVRNGDHWQTNETLRVADEENSFSGERFLIKTESSTASGSDLAVVDPSKDHLLLVATGADSKHFVAAQFDGTGEISAVRSMRLNADARDDLVILDKNNSAPKVLLTAPNATFTVTNTNDSGAGSLRQAILSHNATAGGNTINFNISGSPPFTINFLSSLPTITTNGLLIDATTQPGFAGVPNVVLNSNGASNGPEGISIFSDNNVVRGLVITKMGGPGIIVGDTAISAETYDNNIFEGNYIGIGANGTGTQQTTGNAGQGIIMRRSNNNLIGGTVPAARNVISANAGEIATGDGGLSGDPSGNIIRGNYIGTDATGTQSLNTNGGGISFSARTSFIVGGTIAGARNIISGNTSGISLGNSSSGLVQGNYIGTDATGTISARNGVGIAGSNCGNAVSIGGTTPAAGNVISGNTSIGINSGGGCSNMSNGLTIQGNYIGTRADGTSPLPNQTGIRIEAAFIRDVTVVGGTTPGTGNIIAFNSQFGVNVTGAPSPDSGGGTILGNSIYSNDDLGVGTGLGIDISPNGVNLNDPGDADIGPNGLQNFPVLNSANSATGNTIVNFSFSSKTNMQYRVEFFANPSCDPTGFGEGKNYLGTKSVTTDAGGNVTDDFSIPATSVDVSFITATATANTGITPVPSYTSEFSRCLANVVSVSGRVLTSDGRGLRNAMVSISDSNGVARTATTSSFGFYFFDNILTGGPYTIRVSSRLFRFAPRTLQVTGNVSDADFVGLE